MIRSIFRTGLRATDMVTAGDAVPAGTRLATPGLDPLTSAARPDSPSAGEPPSEEGCLDYDLWVLRQEISGPHPVMPSTQPTVVTPNAPLVAMSPSDRDTLGSGPSTAPLTEVSVPAAAPPGSCPGPSNVVLRRTARSTAGHHSNRHHLPQPVRQEAAPASASNAVSAWFRPWC